VQGSPLPPAAQAIILSRRLREFMRCPAHPSLDYNHSTTMASLDSLKLELARQVEGEVRFDVGTRAAYSTDASNYRQVPVGVVIPRHEGDVIAALSLAREASIPILARGGGTSLAGQACNAALVLDFSKYMNRVLAIDPDARTALVEPGVVQSHLNTALAPHGPSRQIHRLKIDAPSAG
jgi:hypothetical protein